jgi:hypothetical protein
MIDYFNIATNIDTQVFFATGISTGSSTVTSGSWQTWTKPRNATFVFITAIGGGGGGGCAFNDGVNFNGGGGGGSAAIAKGIFPANLIPDVLYIKVGEGGAGSAGGGNGISGNPGQLSYICVQPTSSYDDTQIRNSNILLLSGISPATVGANASSGGGGSGGSGGANVSENSLPLFSLGIVQGFAGTTGTNGGTGTGAITAITPTTITTGGGGGAGGASGATVLGGLINSQSIVPQISSNSSGFAAQQPSGLVSQKYPMQFTGGAGGSTSNLFGQIGGNGAYGSGGGGAAVDTIVTSRFGGHGGDGVVIITCF